MQSNPKVSYPSETRMREIFNTLERYIETRYGVPVIIKDVPDPFTGDLNGAEIHVDHDIGIEDAVFILVHLFGHTLQWNLSDEAREIGSATQLDPSEERLAALAQYEQEACRYGVQLLHDAGIRDLDQWLSDFAACDFAYLRHFYKTGEKKPLRDFWREGTPVISPLAIPSFSPTCWVGRFQGIVV